jgi:predicted RecA/RadA family phage recombinase
MAIANECQPYYTPGRDLTGTASGEVVGILRGGVVPITAGGTIAAGARVEVGSTGKVVTLASGVAIGMCLTGATNNNDAMIALSI